MSRSSVTPASPAGRPPAAPLALRDDTSPDPGGHIPSRVRQRITVPLILLGLILLAPGVWVLLVPQSADVGTPLGASAELPGGLTRIHGVIPLESDGWAPPESDDALARPTGAGMHRVRILLEVTALGSTGIPFSATDYAIDGFGAGHPRLLWASPEQQTVEQGESLRATLVFEIPNQNVALTLTGENGMRLALGAGHHRE